MERNEPLKSPFYFSDLAKCVKPGILNQDDNGPLQSHELVLVPLGKIAGISLVIILVGMIQTMHYIQHEETSFIQTFIAQFYPSCRFC